MVATTMTLAAWKRMLKVGMKLKCVFRWYWKKPHEITSAYQKPEPPDGFELCELVEVRVTQCVMRTPKHERSFMDYPKATELKATESGFDLYFPSDPKWGERAGKLMSRYEYVS